MGMSGGVVAEARDRHREETVAAKRIRGRGEGDDGGGGTPSLPAVGGEAVGCLAVCREHRAVVQYKHVATIPTTGEHGVRVTELVFSPSLRSLLT